jgi:hypothetical protein
VDLRKWLPGENWDHTAFAYRRAAVAYQEQGSATLPSDFQPGKYIIALAVRMPPLTAVKAVEPWAADPPKEPINPWRYWGLEAPPLGVRGVSPLWVTR